MNIYLIQRLGSGYDEYAAHVICAETAPKARKLAAAVHADEGPDVWLKGYSSKVTLIGVATRYKKGKIILSDFNAG